MSLLKLFSVRGFKPNILHWFILFVLLLPLFIGDFFKSSLLGPVLIFGNNKYTPVLLITLGLSFSIFFLRLKITKPTSNSNSVFFISLIFSSYILLQVVTGLSVNPVLRLFEIIGPVFFAAVLLKLLPDNTSSSAWIVKKSFLCLIIYCLAYFFLWFFKTRHIFDVNPHLGFARFRTPLSGAVTFGQILAAVPLTLLLKIEERKKILSVIGIIFFLSLIYLTGTRSALYAMVMTMVIVLIINQKVRLKFLKYIIGAFLFLASVLTFFDLTYERFLNTQTSRTASQWGAIEITFSDISSLLFGQGLSNFFPYEEFYRISQMGGDEGLSDINTFSYMSSNYQSYILLVEPHSTYIWLFVETGLCGLLLFMLLVKNPIRNSLSILRFSHRYNTVWVGLSLFCLCVLIANFAGSIFINEPYVAAICWFFFFLLNRYPSTEEIIK